jgi:hypothetical protein
MAILMCISFVKKKQFEAYNENTYVLYAYGGGIIFADIMSFGTPKT